MNNHDFKKIILAVIFLYRTICWPGKIAAKNFGCWKSVTEPKMPSVSLKLTIKDKGLEIVELGQVNFVYLFLLVLFTKCTF